MNLKNISLRNFRNFLFAEADLDSGVNVFLGENAQGKTNLLEAIYYLSCGKSFRTRYEKDLICFEKNDAEIRGVSHAREREFDIRICLNRGKRKKVTINNLSPKKIDATNILNTVCFTPEDLNLIRAGEAERRRFLNNVIASLRPKYSKAINEYTKTLEQKTKILQLSDERPDLLKALPEFTTRLCQIGALIIRYRAYFIERLSEQANVAQWELTNGKEKLEIEYKTVSSITDVMASTQDIFNQLMEHAEQHKSAELACGQCLTGPHKDSLIINLGGKLLKSFGSQGQTRTAALALKIAELEITKQEINDEPILLLDDVLSELDEIRQNCVLNRITNGQVIITCCEEPKNLHMSKVIKIKNGEII